MNWHEASAVFFKVCNSGLLLGIFYYLFIKKIRPAVHADIALEHQQEQDLHDQIAELRLKQDECLQQIEADLSEMEVLRHKLIFWSARVEYTAFLAEKENANLLTILNNREQIKKHLYIKNRLFHEALPRIKEELVSEVALFFADKKKVDRYLEQIVTSLDLYKE